MNRKAIVALITVLLAGILAIPVRAQSDDPPPQAASAEAAIHIVQRGETMFSIAQRYGMTADTIAHTNGVPDPRRIFVGQRLVIPNAKVDAEQDATTAHIVEAGDTLTTIATRYHTTWQHLVQINDLLSPNAVYAGQVVQVPTIDTRAGTEESVHLPMEGGLVYIVRPDDTLFRIALQYGISPWNLAASSHVANPALVYPGQELTIPGAGPGLLPTPFSAVEVQPLPVSQGTTMIIAVHTTEPVTLEGTLFGQALHFAEEGHVYYCPVGVHVLMEPGLYELELTAVDEQGRTTAISTGVIIEAGRFGYERIDLPASRSGLLDPAVYVKDRERFDTVRSIFTPERFWTVPFQRPCRGAISAYFGSHRSYNGGPYTTYHSGVDFRSPGGTSVLAAAAGTVVLAEPLSLWGNAVVVDHGWGIVTGYAHLSQIGVQVGQQVQRGETVGKVGNTGLSTGSHLHWEMWVSGNSVNGLEWLDGPYPWPGAEQLGIGG